MQVKKNRVDHSDNTHDDNVFSYLMALHVWYEGHDLMEKYGIRKNTIKTDEDVELIEGDIETAEEKKVKMDLHQLEYDEDEDLNDMKSAYQFLEETKNFKTSAQFKDETYLHDMQVRDNLLMFNTAARESFCQQNNIDPSTYTTNTIGIDTNVTVLPDSLFGGVGDEQDDGFDMFNDNSDIYDPTIKQGRTGNYVENLSGYWDQL